MYKNLYKTRWLILLASCIVTICIGSLYAWSAFATPKAEYLSMCTGHEVTSLAVVFTIAISIGPITMVGGGAVNDRLGPRGVLIAGGLLFGGGMILSGFAQSVTAMAFSYGIAIGLGDGLIYGIATSNTVKFFPDRAGFVGGLITACYGASAIIMPPIAFALTQSVGINAAFMIVGAAIMVVVFACSFIIKPCPEDFMRPEHGAESTGEENEFTYRQMLRQPKFYMMLLLLLCGAFSGTMIISQAAQVAEGMMLMTAQSAALVVSFVAVFNTVGRLTSGALSDRFGALATMRVTFAGTICAGAALFFCSAENTVLFYVAVAVISFCFGGVSGIYPGFTARQFGRKHNSVNFGIMFIGFAIAGFCGPMIMDLIFSVTGRYQGAFLAAAILAVVGEVIIALLRKRVV